MAEAVRALDDLQADGVVLLANNAGTYLGQDGQDDLFAALDARAAVVFIHPAELPWSGGSPCCRSPPTSCSTPRRGHTCWCATDPAPVPNIRFILSHAGGFVPYASHRMALSIFGDTGASPTDNLDDFASFYFDTALSSSPGRALPSLLAFAQPGTSPSAPTSPSHLFRRPNCSPGNFENYSLDSATRAAIDRNNALALFPRLGTAAAPPKPSRVDAAKHRQPDRDAAASRSWSLFW